MSEFGIWSENNCRNVFFPLFVSRQKKNIADLQWIMKNLFKINQISVVKCESILEDYKHTDSFARSCLFFFYVNELTQKKKQFPDVIKK